MMTAERRWHPTPGERVLVRNAGEYGYEDLDGKGLCVLEADYQGIPMLTVGRVGFRVGRTQSRLARVFVDGRRSVTVLRSDLASVEPPGEGVCPTCGQPTGQRADYDPRIAEIEASVARTFAALPEELQALLGQDE